MLLSEEVCRLYKCDWPEENRLPEVTSIGCYPLVYITDDGDNLCGDCASKAVTDPDVKITTVRPYWEGPEIECDGGCGEMIQSAYGDPEEGVNK